MSGAISEYADMNMRYAGSLDGGATDCEYTIPPYALPAGGKPDLRTSGEIIAEQEQRIADLEYRMTHLEHFIQRHTNRTEGVL